MIDVQALCERSHTISESKGWTQIKRTDAQNCNLIVSELSEALEDFRNNKGVNEIYFENNKKNPLRCTDEKLKDIPEAERNAAGIKPCGIPIEMADFLIRIAQHCGTNKLDLASDVSRVIRDVEAFGVKRRKDLNEAIADATRFVSRSWKASPEFDAGHDASVERGLVNLAKAFVTIMFFCEENEIFINVAISMKENFNMTRPHRHGGKAI